MDPQALRVAREVRATGWYLGHRATEVGASVCAACAPSLECSKPGEARADTSTLLAELHKGKGRTLPLQAQPIAMENRYKAQLRRRVREVHKLMVQAMREAVAPLSAEINARARADAVRADGGVLELLAGTTSVEDRQLAEALAVLRVDSQATDTRKLLAVVAQVERAVAKASPVQMELLLTLAQQVRAFTSRSVTKQLLTVAGLDTLPTMAPNAAAELLAKWARTNAELITSLDARYFNDIRNAVVATVGEGHSTRALTRAIADRYGVSRSRAELIAVDQVGTLNAQITEHRQTSLGIEEYIWSNSGDTRVRPLHRNAPEGLGETVRRWDDPHPTEGHPGMPIRCRCSAIPKL